MRKAIRWKVAAVATVALLVTACGDDEDEAADTTEAVVDSASAPTTPAATDTTGTTDEGEAADFEIAPEDAEFCAIAATLDQQEDFPSPEQLEEYGAAAPDAISDAANTVVEAFVAAGDDPFSVFEDEEIGRLFEEEIEPFEAEHCGLHGDDEDDGEEQDPSVTEADPSAAQIAVEATEFAFTLDPAPEAGRTQFTMTNAGAQRHVMVLFQIADGSTIDDVLASEGEEGIVEGTEFESDTAAAGETAILTTDLTAGEYGMICYIPDEDGTPHAALGMVASFTVD